MRVEPVPGSRMALSVLMFCCVGATDHARAEPLDDPVGPRLFRKGDGKYRVIGGVRQVHPLFRRLFEQSDPGAYGFLVCRLLYMDDLIRKEVNKGLDQLVILGAGYDTRAYRMASELAGVTVYEVDLPRISRDKRARLRSVGNVIPRNVRFVETDFKENGLFDQLSESGFNSNGRTLFLLCGVSYYLPGQAMREVVGQISSQGGIRSTLVFDYMFDDLVTSPERYQGAAEFLGRAENAGEPIQWTIAMDNIGAFLDDCGLVLGTQHDFATLSDQYLRRADGRAHAKPYGFAAVATAIAPSLAE